MKKNVLTKKESHSTQNLLDTLKLKFSRIEPEFEPLEGKIKSINREYSKGLPDHTVETLDWDNKFGFENTRCPERELKEGYELRFKKAKKVFKLLGGTGSAHWNYVTVRGNALALYFYFCIKIL